MINYHMPLYRPPSEARSLIIQATLGCSYNQCTFCSMYKTKTFQARDLKDIRSDLLSAKNSYRPVTRIFLADGDALALSTDRLFKILDLIREIFPNIERVSAYATGRNILGKTEAELRSLREKGLSMLYIGLESGDEAVLESINKGETAETIIASSKKVMDAGIVLSMTVISGLGGRKHKASHAVNTAKALSRIKPDYIGFLALMIEPDTILYEQYQKGEFIPLSPAEIVQEMIVFLNNIDSEASVFRCNHASNYFNLSGVLNRDITPMLHELEEVKSDMSMLKDEKYRLL